VWHSGEGGYMSCGIVGMGVKCHSGMGGYVSCGIVGRAGICVT